MFNYEFIGHCLGLKGEFEISKENKGDKLIVTFSGDKNDIKKLEKKLDAFQTLTGDCCKDGCC
jgi:hypothetical protein